MSSPVTAVSLSYDNTKKIEVKGTRIYAFFGPTKHMSSARDLASSGSVVAKMAPYASPTAIQAASAASLRIDEQGSTENA